MRLMVHATVAALCVSPLASAFTNPIRTVNSSDPQMQWYNGSYYYLATAWSDVEVVSATTINGLKTAIPTVVYNDKTDPSRARNWWAPEMWRIDGRWYIYFATTVDAGDAWDVMIPSLTTWVLEGGTGNPLDTPFVAKGQVKPANYHSGMLDSTVYEIDGQKYFFYSAINSTESPNGASIWIAKLLTPTSLSNATMIAYPTLDWEKSSAAILEGPAGITSPDGTVYISYAADDCNTPAYKLGTLKLTKGADPLLAASWTKLPQPLLQTNEGLGLYGPGHNGFFKSPDGKEDWIVYHANRDAAGRCNEYRQSFAQKVEWNADGSLKLVPIGPDVEIKEPSGTVAGCHR
ncbi:glycosyl hydrolase [Coniochaeta sp. 2T2.1]|nr:glycosyl hydrolase [Coniochaeta sp. 2T2.1]